MKTKIAAHAVSMRGSSKNRSENQDGFAYDLEKLLFVVSDGISTQDAGQLAAFLVVWAVWEDCRKNGPIHKQMVFDALERAQMLMVEYAQRTTINKLGACGTVFWLEPIGDSGDHWVHIVHIGDARIVIIDDLKMTQSTEPHRSRKGRLERYLGSHSPHGDLGVYSKARVRRGAWILAMTDALNVLDGWNMRDVIDEIGQEGPYAVALRLVEIAKEEGTTDDATVLAVAT